MRLVILPIRASLLFLFVWISLNLFDMFASSFPNRIHLRLRNGMRCSFCCSFGACYLLQHDVFDVPVLRLATFAVFLSC